MQEHLVQWGHTRILWLMAAEVEYGARLQSLFKPLITGVGPVEAAISSARALAVLETRGMLPDMVVSLGSAGSARLKQTEIYQARSVSWRDIDATALGVPKGQTPFLDLPAEISLPLYLADIPAVRLSTGANVVSGDAYDNIDADMVEMESYAILRACQFHALPLMCLRGISDGVAELQGIKDWTQYLDIVDEKLAMACLELKARAEAAVGVVQPVTEGWAE